MKLEIVLTPCENPNCPYPNLAVINPATGGKLIDSCISLLSIGEAMVATASDGEIKRRMEILPPRVVLDQARTKRLAKAA